MVQVSASEKFYGQSYGWFKVGSMDMKIWKFDEKHEIWWNVVIGQIWSENQFVERFERQNPSGSCAARNIQDFGGATCMIHGWWLWLTLVHGKWAVNFEFEYVNERWWAFNSFNMACRDGPTLKLVPFLAILLCGRRQFAPSMASNY